MQEEPSRKLVVILHADVVGSTSLVQANETVAHRRIRDAFERLSTGIKARGGTPHEIRGDALVAEFSRASDAVEAALSFQADNTAYLDDLRDDIKPNIRIGIAMGEVVVADGTVTGEAVVLAQRLEQIAGPGEVCIQATAQDTVPARLPYTYEQLSERMLKGFSKPVRAYLVRWASESLAEKRESVPLAGSRHLDLSNKPSIAILPFVNMSGDSEQEYFSDGITEDITTELGRFGSIDIIARQTAFVLRDEAGSAADTFAGLGADYLLQGSIRKAGDRIRLTTKLIDLETRKQVWADRYDRELDDIFTIQDELVHAVVATIAGRVVSEGLERALRKPAENLAAYDCYLQGLWYDRKYDRDSITAGREVMEKAITLDPTFARAYGLLASFMMAETWFTDPSAESSNKILDIAKKAVELDSTDADCFAKLALVQLDRGERDEAGRNFETALNLNPHDPDTWGHYAWFLVTLGQARRALEYLDRMRAVDPLPPKWTWDIRAEALFGLERYEEAATILEGKAAHYPHNFAHLAACYGYLGRKDEAAACWSKFLEVFPNSRLTDVGADFFYVDKADEDRWTQGLRRAGLKD